MGPRNSTNRRRQPMDRETGESSRSTSNSATTEGGRDSPEPDLATMLSYLIRSGQVRILASGRNPFNDDEDNDDDDDDDYCYDSNFNPKPPTVVHPPDTTHIDRSDFKQQICLQAGLNKKGGPGKKGLRPTISHMLYNREVGMNGRECFSGAERCLVNSAFLPKEMEYMARYHQKAFCGTYSEDGSIFLSACQDQHVRVYDTTNGKFKQIKRIRARDVGWSVLDTAFSPDGNYLIYSSWSESIHMCNIHGDYDTHTALPLHPDSEANFCIFSLKFSSDNKEILGGANDGCLYVYDRERNSRTLRISAHEDDVNAVTFADASSQIVYSGGDDGLCKVWDRRMLNEDYPIPVGILAGHSDGITFIDTKGDARHLISNCKDQTIKLWDIRKFSSEEAQENTRKEVANQRWDYRWQQVPKNVRKIKMVPGDSSLMTYRGHSVLHTLVRSRFSPSFTTSQRFIYTGCASGRVVIYDSLTGEIVQTLEGHRGCVRDVSWHPYDMNIMSTSWDGTIALWNHRSNHNESESEEELSANEEDTARKTRGKRKKQKRDKKSFKRSFLWQQNFESSA